MRMFPDLETEELVEYRRLEAIQKADSAYKYAGQL